MLGALANHSALRIIGKGQLIKLKMRAIRSGVWFKALQRIDRVLIDLTIKVTDTIRSAKLANSILMLTNKLESAMESRFSRAIREVGLPLAQKLSSIAKKLGNTSAKDWIHDSDFAVYLAVMQINNKYFQGLVI